MKTWNILLKQSSTDLFDIEVPENEGKLVINTDQQGLQDTVLSTNVFTELKSKLIVIGENIHDLLHVAIGVYTVDQGISRDIYGFQQWSRHIKLFVPVSAVDDWNTCKSEIESLLSFLSGDRWEIEFRKQAGEQKKFEFPQDTNQSGVQVVSLFSGGMDSFIGAVDLLEDKRKVHFVSHYKRGAEGNVQRLLYDALEGEYGESTFDYTRFWVQPTQKNEDLSKERSSRARSFLFLCLGVSVANSLGQDIEFIIPENGLISLNVPLTGTRLSSHSTRTTHPYYLDTFRTVMVELGILNPIRNPYQFQTKGEMAKSCSNTALLRKLNKTTISCAHPDNSRRTRGNKPGIQCGYCVPCIIRRSAEKMSKLVGTEYVQDIINTPPLQTKKTGSDMRAFKLALERMDGKSERSIMFDVLQSGPLPFNSIEELKQYMGVYRRGMNEVRSFLGK
jgi:7-cyano-7-deazaguanine synthase in queuosine biosynthesis